MAIGPSTQIADVVVPEIFTPYMQQMTEEKARLVQAGVLTRSTMLDQFLAGGGKTFDMPSWKPLDNDADNVSTDAVADRIEASNADAWPSSAEDSIPRKTGTSDEVAVRLSRNQSWGSADLSEALAGDDPMDSVASEVAYYWARRMQAAFIATCQGVSKDNGVNDSGDLAHDIAASAFSTATRFNANAYLRAKLTMGDSMNDLAVVIVHSIVFNRMQEENLIDFIPDARGETRIPTYMDAEVITDDGMPNGLSAVRAAGTTGDTGIYESWLFGRGAAYMGVGSPRVPTEVARHASGAGGGGMEVLHSRQEWIIHPRGFAYTGTAPNGGPGNGTGAHQLNVASSWDRVFPERKMIKFARLITREHV